MRESGGDKVCGILLNTQQTFTHHFFALALEYVQPGPEH